MIMYGDMKTETNEYEICARFFGIDISRQLFCLELTPKFMAYIPHLFIE